LDYSENIIIETKTALFGEINKEELRRRTRDLLLPKLISGEVDVENIDVQMPNNGGA
jgi:hypothetical protein